MTQNMKDIITNEYFMLALTFGVYYLAKTLQRRLAVDQLEMFEFIICRTLRVA